MASYGVSSVGRLPANKKKRGRAFTHPPTRLNCAVECALLAVGVFHRSARFNKSQTCGGSHTTVCTAQAKQSRHMLGYPLTRHRLAVLSHQLHGLGCSLLVCDSPFLALSARLSAAAAIASTLAARSASSQPCSFRNVTIRCSASRFVYFVLAIISPFQYRFLKMRGG